MRDIPERRALCASRRLDLPAITDEARARRAVAKDRFLEVAKLPWIQFFPSDWVDDEVSGCSLAAQGLWLRMLFLMHSSERYGYLTTNGVPTPPEIVARRCGATLDQYTTLLAELESAGVPGRTEDKTIFSRRLVRDQSRRVAERDKKRKQRNPDQKDLSRRCPGVVPPSVPALSPPLSPACPGVEVRNQKSEIRSQNIPITPLPGEQSAPTPGQPVSERDSAEGRALLTERFADAPHDATDDVPEAILQAVKPFIGASAASKMVRFKLADCIALTSAETLLAVLQTAASENPRPSLTAIMARAKTVEGGKGFTSAKGGDRPETAVEKAKRRARELA